MTAAGGNLSLRVKCEQIVNLFIYLFIYGIDFFE